jgi:hypothetical protein
MLSWDETEFLAILESIPVHEQGDGGDYWLFRHTKGLITLEVVVFPFESDIEINLYSGELVIDSRIYHQSILNCAFARTIRNNNEEFIEFVGNTNVTTTVGIAPNIFVNCLDTG